MATKTSRASKAPAYKCAECGWTAVKWVGRCGECQAWGTVEETGTAVARTTAATTVLEPARRIAEVDATTAAFLPTGVDELDRVLGGGLVPGAVILLAGEPGVGKSTLLLDVAAKFARTAQDVLYVTGEESAAQVKLRAERIDAVADSLYLSAETDLGQALGQVEKIEPRLLIVDSVQTLSSADVDGSAGGVSQVREVAASIIAAAKRRNMTTLLDTPGHADFSEDTYRVLAAVDCAVMLVDAAKGLETQTMKLFEVCKQRNLPIITVINKWDRPGLDALALMDELTERTGLQPMPLTWAVGISGDFRGVWDLRNDRFASFKRNNSGANIALTEYFTPGEAAVSQGNNWTDAVDEAGLVIESNLEFDVDAFHAGTATPILFSSAALNFGVKEILDALVDFAPPAAPRPDVDGSPRAVESPFSGFVFKVQAGMNKAHRDHVAFIRVCSGVFERGMVVTQTRTGKSFATKYAQQVFGREREVIDEAYPGDVVGLVNASSLRVGDSLFLEDAVEYPAIPLFAPEHFQVARSKDPSKFKQFRRGIEQLEHEGVIQVLRSDVRGDQAPVLAAVGPMQFEVVEDRMAHDFSAPMRLERLPYSIARISTAEAMPALANVPGAEVLLRSDGEYLALFNDVWALRRIEKNHPDLTLVPIGTHNPAK